MLAAVMYGAIKGILQLFRLAVDTCRQAPVELKLPVEQENTQCSFWIHAFTRIPG